MLCRYVVHDSRVRTRLSLGARPEILISLIVSLGVLVAGVYDFVHEQPPGRLGLDSSAGIPIFVAACLAATATSVVLVEKHQVNTASLVGPLGFSLFSAVVADPTYASLLTAAPLVEIRRRGRDPWKTSLTAAILIGVAVLVFTERAPAATNEVETRLGLAISFLLLILLGDALHKVDETIVAETDLARVQERSRITEDLHDSLGHHLLAASVQLEKARALHKADPATVSGALNNSAQALAAAVGELRRTVDFERGASELATETSIQELARLIVPSETQIDIDVLPNHAPLRPEAEVAIYRFVQEALSNLVRHSSATTASIRSTAGDQSIRFEVSDNGTGFDLTEERGRGGLSNMQRRIERVGGTLEVTSGSEGTSLVAQVPR